jgi:hypothetical protein
MALLNGISNANSAALLGGTTALNQVANSIAQIAGGPTSVPNAPGNGLPSSQVQSSTFGSFTRNTIHFFVPEVGIVNMYINPQSINYNHSKLITPERTKGGFVIQYWGEELTTLRLNGHTGSSGVEGLNVLYEIYRAEQIMFDTIASSMSSDNSVAGLGSLVDSTLGNLGGLGTTISNATTGIMSLDPASQNIVPSNIPSLASMAFGVELYYSGWIFRGYFKSMSYTESTAEMGLFQYNIEFVVTQRSGYRTNQFAFQKSAIMGPSNNGYGGPPLTFAGLANGGQSSLNSSGQGPFSGT